MRFHSIKMLGFKKYTNSQIEFGPGLNIFHGPNEAGKSTLHQALITGLYGLSRRSDEGLLKAKSDARSWQNVSECLIELEYAIGDQRFLLSRDLESGKVQLCKISSDGERFLISENRDEIDARIHEQTGIESAYVFNRTISVCQADLAQASDLKRVGDNIESVFAGSAAISASDAVEFIDKQIRKPLRRMRNESPGRLDRYTERLENLIAEIDRAKRGEQHLEELAQLIETLAHRLPQKRERLHELVELIHKSESRKKIEEKLNGDRKQFDSLEERIRKIEDCSEKLNAIEEDIADLGAIKLFDPDQLDTVRVQLERGRAGLESKAAACNDRIQAMQKRMQAAEELSGQIALIEQQIGEYGKLAGEDLDAIDARRRELIDKFKSAELNVKALSDRLEQIRHNLWGLEQFAKKYPNLGDAWQLQSEWQKLELHKEEHKRTLERGKQELSTHEANRLPPTFGNPLVELPLPLACLATLLASILIDWLSLPVKIAIAALALGVLVWWIVLKTKRRSLREQWRTDHRRLQDAVTEFEKNWRQICSDVEDFTNRVGIAEGQIHSFIDEYRTNQNDLATLRREHEQYLKELDAAQKAKDDADREGRRLGEEFGCQNLMQLRDKLAELRELHSETDKLSERLAGVLDIEKAAAPHQMIMAARNTLAELQDQKKQIEAEQMDLAHRESEFLQRTSCDDLLQLAERTKRLRTMLTAHEKLTATLEAHAAGRTLEQLKGEQREYSLEIKVAVTRLEEDFAGFEPTAEQTEFWRKERERLESEIPDMQKRLTEAQTELKLLEDRTEPSSAELEGEKQYIVAEITRGDLTVTATQVAIDVLREVEREHHEIYLPLLETDTGEYFARVTGGAYSSVSLVDSWPKNVVAVDKAQRQIDADKLSRGTADQLYFSLRLALAKALSGRTQLPLVLDDPFVNFDSDRLEEAFNTILQLVRDGRQVIYFTHSPAPAQRKEEFEQQGIPVHCVRLGGEAAGAGNHSVAEYDSGAGNDSSNGNDSAEEQC